MICNAETCFVFESFFPNRKTHFNVELPNGKTILTDAILNEIYIRLFDGLTISCKWLILVNSPLRKEEVYV